jgi:hypothetical protein
VIGDRFEVLGESGDFYNVRMYGGKDGFVAKGMVKAEDPKTYFATTIGGKKVSGFLRGPAHCSFINEVRVKVGLDTGGEVAVPIPRISKIDAGPNGLTIWTDDGEEYHSTVAQWRDSWGGRPAVFWYGELAHVRSGHGTQLPIETDKIGAHLVLEKIKTDVP